MRIIDWSSDVCSSFLQIGLAVYKVGMSWPLEREGIRRFAEGLEEILVVEEKRAVIENQVKEQLYNWRGDARPRVVGKFDETGERSEEHTSELQSLMSISYAVFCLKTKKPRINNTNIR